MDGELDKTELHVRQLGSRPVQAKFLDREPNPVQILQNFGSLNRSPVQQRFGSTYRFISRYRKSIFLQFKLIKCTLLYRFDHSIGHRSQPQRKLPVDEPRFGIEGSSGFDKDQKCDTLVETIQYLGKLIVTVRFYSTMSLLTKPSPSLSGYLMQLEVSATRGRSASPHPPDLAR